MLTDNFQNGLLPAWSVTEVGAGRVRQAADGLALTLRPTPDGYSNAQIADYAYRAREGQPAFAFRWRPPVQMRVTAWASAPADGLRGTAGFGFWNHPFSPDIRRAPRLPQAIWFFFGSPPNDMRLALDQPGHGWKAATIDAGRPSALLLAPLALPAVLLMRVPALYRRLWGGIQRALAVHEAALPAALLAERHSYGIDWRADGATFTVDEQVVLEAPAAPRGACGFIVWLDNQYAVVAPQGRIGFGVVPVEREQSLTVAEVRVSAWG